MCCKNVVYEAVGINYKLMYNIYAVVIEDCSVMQNSTSTTSVEEYGNIQMMFYMFECFFLIDIFHSR